MDKINDKPVSHNCADPDLVYLFPLYIRGELDAKGRERVDEHLRQCMTCRRDMRFFEDLQRIGREIFSQFLQRSEISEWQDH